MTELRAKARERAEETVKLQFNTGPHPDGWHKAIVEKAILESVKEALEEAVESLIYCQNRKANEAGIRHIIASLDEKKGGEG